MNVDVLYLCHGRLEFTQATLPTLVANTDWDYVNEFVVYNDSAEPGDPTSDFVLDTICHLDNATLRQTNLHGPVAVMNHFLRRVTGEAFAKIDNDIVVPPGWLDDLLDAMEDSPEFEFIGMQPDMGEMCLDGPWQAGMPKVVEASHIGGVGLMRVSAFRGDRPPPVANGRFGFTEWQHQWGPKRGWVVPGIEAFELDRIPVEPWRSITARYREEGLNRDWSEYPMTMAHYWDWWTGAAE